MRQFLVDESGATAIEYALIAMMISLAILGGATAIGTALQTPLNTAATAITP